MKKALVEFPRERRMAAGRLITGLVAVIALAGCDSLSLPIHKPAGSYTPKNVYRADSTLPARVKRVAVLPLTTPASTALLEAGVESLEPILLGELDRTRRFELIPVSGEQLRQWAGKSTWRADESLPRELFDRVRDGTGCDAVLFCQLTRYEPYQPIVIGWKFSLVEAAEKPAADEPKTRILWSVDESFDSGDPAVANSAQSYYSQHLRNESPSSDASTVLRSPARFGEYTLNAVLKTLPERQK